MKKIFLFAATAALFAACSSDSGVDSPQTVQTPSEGVAVDFGAYINRAATRAGQTGELTTSTGSFNLQTTGFGVFAYYTNADNYDQNFIPDFMYNQRVYYSSGWTYSPKKYWPNEFGGGALSDDVDKVSFFAYAPFVTVNASSGKVSGNGSVYADDNGDATMGIVGMKRNNDTGDPMIKYISTFYTDKQVDLTWGVADTDANVTWNLKNTGTQTIDMGMPWKDIQHPSGTSTAQKVAFEFDHALASLNVQVDTYADVPTPTGGTTPAAPDVSTKVFVRSVTFQGFDVKGALNLNNATANTAFWYNFDCVNELNNGAEVTIKDGRKDGKEGLTAATKEYAAINPNFVQSAVWASTTTGVNATPANLFCKANGDAADAATDPIFVIPNDDPLMVTIEYDVLTADTKLAGTVNDGVTKGSVVKNVITRYITTNEAGNPSSGTFTLENGKRYTIKLHLGLNSVKFDASVSDWEIPVTGGADLPHNN